MELNKQSLEELFGSFRAEWLREKIYSFFNEPGYFAHLNSPKSCVLIGGRGSGKTTALKCMSYEGQFALGNLDAIAPKYIGFYLKVNTNTVTSFSGPELSEEDWGKLFNHYVNLSICEEISNYLIWRERNQFGTSKGVDFTRVCEALGVEVVDTAHKFLASIDQARLRLEMYINNLGQTRPRLSPRQTPLSLLMSELKKLDGHCATSFYIIFDEYENFLDYQQRVVNTLLKHGGDNYFFKIGVRELGWRVRSTLGEHETLISPADYERIHIEEALKDTFVEFARDVCQSRMAAHAQGDEKSTVRMDSFLAQLTLKEEAELLGVAPKVASLRGKIEGDPESRHLATLHDYELFVFQELNKGDPSLALRDITAYAASDKAQLERYGNYSYALLFLVASKGARIQKYYTGLQTMALLSARNIRFFMQLLNESIRLHIEAGSSASTPISPEIQTLAARDVGLTYLRELEGVSTQGAKLAKLILGLGRLFQIMASNPVGAKPECNQFEINKSTKPSIDVSIELDRLLSDAVMHLALLRSQGTKLLTEGDTRSWDYSPHPIFSAYFGYSHRRKRKMAINDHDLLGIVSQPQEAIRKLLGRRSDLVNDTLPAQMSLFDEYFT